MVKVQQLPSGQLILTIPKVLAEYEGLSKGMEVEFKKHKDGFLLEVRKKENKDSRGGTR
jgi:phosphate uptake regulator